HELAPLRACLHFARIANDEGGADAFLVGEAALGAQAVLAEELAVVAEERDERVIELALALQYLQDRAHALVDRCHHSCALPDLLLLARVQLREDRPCKIRLFEPEGFGPRR